MLAHTDRLLYYFPVGAIAALWVSFGTIDGIFAEAGVTEDGAPRGEEEGE